MKFLLDENFPISITNLIEDAGHNCIQFRDVCAQGIDDETVFTRAQELRAVILTSDMDFYHTIPLIHPQHSGIVVVALRQPCRRAIAQRIEWFLANVSGSIKNKTFILRDFSCRVKT